MRYIWPLFVTGNATAVRGCRRRLVSRVIADRRIQSMVSKKNDKLLDGFHFQLSNINLRSFSSGETASNTRQAMAQWRNLVKPFWLHCHPDRVQQQSEFAKTVNLQAIQTLNSYLDALKERLKYAHAMASTQRPSSATMPRDADQDVSLEIDFVLLLDPNTLVGRRGLAKQSARQKRQDEDLSRRKVELLLPRVNRYFERRATQELIKLLRVADLPVPNTHSSFPTERGQTTDGRTTEERWWQHELGLDDLDDDMDMDSRSHSDWQQGGGFRPHHIRPRSPYEESRDRFVSGLNWKQYQRLYRQAMQDYHADLATSGLITHDIQRRRRIISTILSNVRVQAYEAPLEQKRKEKSNAKSNDKAEPLVAVSKPVSTIQHWIALRRLSLLLDQHFDDLQLEDYAFYWEERCHIVLTEPYISPDGQTTYADPKHYVHGGRRKDINQAARRGYSYTLHPNNTVSVVVPIDFEDNELIRELDRNLWDFYDIVGGADGLDSLFSTNYAP